MLPATQNVLSEGVISFLFVEISGIPAGGLGCDIVVTLNVSDGTNNGEMPTFFTRNGYLNHLTLSLLMS